MLGKLGEKISKYADIIELIIAALGVIVSAFSISISNKNPILLLVICIILAFEIILVFICFGALYEKSKIRKELSKRDEINKELESNSLMLSQELENKSIMFKDELENKNAELYNSHLKAMTQIGKISNEIKNVSKLNNDFINRIYDIVINTFNNMKIFNNNDEKQRTIEIQQLQRTNTSLFLDLYRRYSTNLLSSVLCIEKTYLSMKGLDLDVSATIKLLKSPEHTNNIDINDTYVYTAFRDKKTYELGNREIGKELYTIGENTPYIQCLKKEFFCINNVNSQSTNYMNEHKDFETYYNCTIVVPIRVKCSNDCYNLLGYLCCDCLNKNENVEAFDNNSAHFLFTCANLYATFLGILYDCWHNCSQNYIKSNENKNIFELIFEHTYRIH